MTDKEDTSKEPEKKTLDDEALDKYVFVVVNECYVIIMVFFFPI